MIDKILAWTSYLPRWKKTKNDFKSTITIEDPIHFPTSVIVASNPLTFLDIFGCGRWKSQQQQNEPKQRKRFTVCRWLRKRRELKENKKKRREEYEQERIKDILRWEQGKQRRREKEQFENLYVVPLQEKKNEISFKGNKHDKVPLSWQKAKKVNRDINIDETKYEPISWPPPAKKKKKIFIDENKKENRPTIWSKPNEAKKKDIFVEDTKYEPLIWSAPEYKKRKKSEKQDIYRNELKCEPCKWSQPVQKKRKMTKNTFIKEKSATAKPRAVTKQVYVKANHPKDSLSNRFVSCCYRFCCQFYCCINCVLIIAFVVMFVL